MVASISPKIRREYPPELIRFAADEAARDAEEVAAFLAAAGLTPPAGETRGFPHGVLLDLGAVVRLRRWEATGHTAHLDAGLPTARAALGQLIDALVEAATNPAAPRTASALGRAVFDAAVGRFAWTARPELGADVALDVTDDDTLVEALARFLWAHRNTGTASE